MSAIYAAMTYAKNAHHIAKGAMKQYAGMTHAVSNADHAANISAIAARQAAACAAGVCAEAAQKTLYAAVATGISAKNAKLHVMSAERYSANRALKNQYVMNVQINYKNRSWHSHFYKNETTDYTDSADL